MICVFSLHPKLNRMVSAIAILSKFESFIVFDDFGFEWKIFLGNLLNHFLQYRRTCEYNSVLTIHFDFQYQAFPVGLIDESRILNLMPLDNYFLVENSVDFDLVSLEPLRLGCDSEVFEAFHYVTCERCLED